MQNQQYTTSLNLLEINKGTIVKNLILPLHFSSQQKIAKVEESLNIKLPVSYIDFLMKCGTLVFGGIDIYGLLADSDDYSVISYTFEERDTNSEFPKSFVVIYDLGNGEKYCLDTSKMNSEGECPVVAWYFGRIEQVYEDFGAFFLDTVKTGLKSLEENGEKINW